MMEVKSHQLKEMLLQQHRLFLSSLILFRALGRVLFVVLLVALIFFGRLGWIRTFLFVATAAFLSFAWWSECKTLSVRIENLEVPVARESGEKEEDDYIRSQYIPVRFDRESKFIQYEPLLWFAMLTAVSIFIHLF